MLKLEKKSKSADIAIQIRAKEPFFEPILMKALLFAFLLHLCAFLLFQVIPFHFSSDYVFPTIRAASSPEWIVVSPTTVASLEEEEIPFHMPSLVPHFRSPSLINTALLLRETPFQPSTLEELQGNWRQEKPFPLSLKLEELAIVMDISGEIAEQKLVKTDDRLNLKQKVNYAKEPTSLTYFVRLDEWNGKLFWTEETAPHHSKEAQKIAEDILSHLEFELPHPRASLSGFITLSFLLRDENL